MLIKRLALMSALGGGAAVLAAPSFAQELQLGAGANYTSGSYGGSGKTTIIETPVSARLKAGAWSFRVSLPFVSVDGPGGVVPSSLEDGGQTRTSNSGPGSSGSGGGSSGTSGGSGSSGSGSSGSGSGGSGTTSGGTTSTTAAAVRTDLGEVAGGVKNSGLGDITVSATWSGSLPGDNYLDITGKAILPTGDEAKGLGRGATDYGVTAELGHDTDGGGFYAFAGYKIRGGTGRDDGATAGAGAYHRFANGMIVGLDGTWTQAALAAVKDAAEVSAYSSFALTKETQLSVYALAGLSQGSPDFGAGLSLTWRPNVRRPLQTR